jgi:hypothetical protein
MRPEVQREFPHLKNTDVSSLLAERWRAAPDEAKRPHLEREMREREKYHEEMAVWRVQEEKKAEEARRLQYVPPLAPVANPPRPLPERRGAEKTPELATEPENLSEEGGADDADEADSPSDRDSSRSPLAALPATRPAGARREALALPPYPESAASQSLHLPFPHLKSFPSAFPAHSPASYSYPHPFAFHQSYSAPSLSTLPTSSSSSPPSNVINVPPSSSSSADPRMSYALPYPLFPFFEVPPGYPVFPHYYQMLYPPAPSAHPGSPSRSPRGAFAHSAAIFHPGLGHSYGHGHSLVPPPRGPHLAPFLPPKDRSPSPPPPR